MATGDIKRDLSEIERRLDALEGAPVESETPEVDPLVELRGRLEHLDGVIMEVSMRLDELHESVNSQVNELAPSAHDSVPTTVDAAPTYVDDTTDDIVGLLEAEGYETVEGAEAVTQAIQEAADDA
jgi:hypothetical protein